MEGQVISHYRLLRKLGSDALGDMWEGVHQDGEPIHVVVRLLHPTWSEEQAFVDGLKREFQSLQTLQHPNIAEYLELVLNGDRLAMVMAVGEGENAFEAAQRRPFSPEQVLDIGRGALMGLSFAHDAGLIHSGIQPSQLWLCANGQTKWIDFGVAMAAAHTGAMKTDMTQDGLQYIAPEQLSGSKADASSDLYALGLSLAELLMGRPACPMGSMDLQKEWHLTQGIKSLDRGSIPAELWSVLLNLASTEMSNRYGSAAEALVAWNAIDLSTSQGPNSPEASPSSGGKSLWFAGLGALVLAVVYVAFGSVFFDVSPGRKLSSESFAVSGVTFETSTISGGSFVMGCLLTDWDCWVDEKPRHKVTIRRDMIVMNTEVTQGLYESVMGVNPSFFADCGKDCPVEQVNWYDAVAFANALSAEMGLSRCYEINGKDVSWPDSDCGGWRLPTEAEWEYLARGGERHLYSGSNRLDDVAWYYGNSGKKTHPVGQKLANGFGLYDMSGSVFEWCWDWYEPMYYKGGAVTDPQGPSSGLLRIRRGGWSGNGTSIRTSNRISSGLMRSKYDLGFRLLRNK